MSTLVEVKVGGLIPDPKTGSHILLLKLPSSAKYLPVWIHQNEAQAIHMAIRKQSFARPLTHDLLKSVLDGLGATVTRVVITTIQDTTFYARIILARDSEIISIDARPSDSVALAVRTGSPIFLTQKLLESQADSLYELESVDVSEGLEVEPSVGLVGDDDMTPALDELMRAVEQGTMRPPTPPGELPGDEDDESA